jgi:hypothetical protein
MKQIPKNILTDSIAVYSGYGENRTAVTLTGLKLIKTSKVTEADNTVTVNTSVLMFYDCQNSAPKNFNFAPGSGLYIIEDGKTLKLLRADIIYDGTQKHHYEIYFGEDYKINAACY